MSDLEGHKYAHTQARTVGEQSPELMDVVAEYSERDLKRLVRKIDLNLLPLMCFTQLLQNVDSTALGYSAVWGLESTLHLNSSQYSWVGGMVFFGYLIFEWPMGLAAQHFHTGKVIGIVVFFWGLTMMSCALTKDFAGIMVQRFVLGALQSIISPAWVLMTSIFYLKDEQTVTCVSRSIGSC